VTWRRSFPWPRHPALEQPGDPAELRKARRSIALFSIQDSSVAEACPVNEVALARRLEGPDRDRTRVATKPSGSSRRAPCAGSAACQGLVRVAALETE